jgi:hypothetical protein
MVTPWSVISTDGQPLHAGHSVTLICSMIFTSFDKIDTP